MPVKDYKTLELVETMSECFNTIVGARFLRTAYESMEISFDTRSSIDQITRENAYYRANGYMFSELYTAILSMGQYVYKTRSEVLPNIKFFLSGSGAKPSEKLREEMAAVNLKSNLDVLADSINNLYLHAVEMDREGHRVKPPVFSRMPELSKLGQLLTESNKGVVR